MRILAWHTPSERVLRETLRSLARQIRVLLRAARGRYGPRSPKSGRRRSKRVANQG